MGTLEEKLAKFKDPERRQKLKDLQDERGALPLLEKRLS